MMLRGNYSSFPLEAGCDEAGRGCLAGPVFAAAVILPPDFDHPLLNDSKKLSPAQRETVRKAIEQQALAWAVEKVSNTVIDEKNILWASVMAMHLALDKLPVIPQFILVDGNKFKPYCNIPHQCIVKGDALFKSIAAASVIAKTYRDAFMLEAHLSYPCYGWDTNKGYPTDFHVKAIYRHGLSPLHRKSFSTPAQMKIPFA